MSDREAPRPSGPEANARAAAEKRRRLAEIFGDVLPDTTSDERDDGDVAAGEDAQDRWLRSQVPPHHG